MIWKKVMTAISHCTLFALPTGESCPTDNKDNHNGNGYEVEEGEVDDGACGGEDGADEDKHEVRLGRWCGGAVEA
jgi:hypothetical protein